MLTLIINLRDWAASVCPSGSMTKETLECFKNSAKPWQLKMDNDKEKYFVNKTISRENYMTEMYKDVNPVYNLKGEEIQEMLIRRAWGFTDWNLANSMGHQDIARGILGTSLWTNITEIFKYRSDNVNDWDDDTGSNCDELTFQKESFSSSRKVISADDHNLIGKII